MTAHLLWLRLLVVVVWVLVLFVFVFVEARVKVINNIKQAPQHTNIAVIVIGIG